MTSSTPTLLPARPDSPGPAPRAAGSSQVPHRRRASNDDLPACGGNHLTGGVRMRHGRRRLDKRREALGPPADGRQSCECDRSGEDRRAARDTGVRHVHRLDRWSHAEGDATRTTGESDLRISHATQRKREAVQRGCVLARPRTTHQEDVLGTPRVNAALDAGGRDVRPSGERLNPRSNPTRPPRARALRSAG